MISPVEHCAENREHLSPQAREEKLIALLKSMESVVVAFSGGVDSTYLADVAADVLKDGAHIVLADSPSLPRDELEEASRLAQERGWRFVILRTNELENEEYRKNDGRRCYHCKSELFRVLRDYAEKNGVKTITYGANMDDLSDPTRLGSMAAAENHVLAPLQMTGMSKADIRVQSAKRGLPTAEKPSFACLASRFPKGTPVLKEDIAKVEKAEAFLKRLGFRQYRVRHHKDLCRIEVELCDLPRLVEPATRESVLEQFRTLGYRFVTVDLAGYRTGSTA